MANTWTMNETQKAFVEGIKAWNAEHEEAPTLADIEGITGRKFATGSINALLNKGILGHAEEREVEVVKVVKVKKATWVVIE